MDKITKMILFGEDIADDFAMDFAEELGGLDFGNIDLGLKDVGVCFYKMTTGVILPIHSDHYNTYRIKFNCGMDQINRVLIFLEDWKSGHYFEVENNPIMEYKAGTFIQWGGDAKHMAANIGEEDRYTLQLTGWK